MKHPQKYDSDCATGLMPCVSCDIIALCPIVSSTSTYVRTIYQSPLLYIPFLSALPLKITLSEHYVVAAFSVCALLQFLQHISMMSLRVPVCILILSFCLNLSESKLHKKRKSIFNNIAFPERTHNSWHSNSSRVSSNLRLWRQQVQWLFNRGTPINREATSGRYRGIRGSSPNGSDADR